MPDLLLVSLLSPFLAAILCMAVSRGSFQILFVVLSTTTSCFVDILAARYIWQEGSDIRFTIGGWPAKYGIELKVNFADACMLFMTHTCALLLSVHAFMVRGSKIQLLKSHYLSGTLFVIVMTFVTGIGGLIAANDVFNIYVFMEIVSISSYAMMTDGQNRESLLSAFDYVIIGTIGATFYLLGIGCIYGSSGLLNIDEIQKVICGSEKIGNLYVFGLALMVIGLSVKGAVFPMHSWAVSAYEHSSYYVAGLLTSIGTKVNLYVLITIFSSVFACKVDKSNSKFLPLIVFSGFGAIFSCGFLAFKSNKIRKILAFSSISQLGYVLLCLSLFSKSSLAAAVIHMLSHGFASSVIFMSLSNINDMLDKDSKIENYMISLSDINVWLLISAAFVLSGLPVTLGFTSKMLIFADIALQKKWFIFFLTCLGSGLTFLYLLRMINIICFKDSTNLVVTDNNSFESSIIVCLTGFVSAAILLISGFYGDFLFRAISSSFNVD